MLNHGVAGDFNANVLVRMIEDEEPQPALLDSLLGQTLEATVFEGEIFLKPAGTDINAIVLTEDVETCAGIMHVVDMVLVPAPPGEVTKKDSGKCTPLGKAARAAGMTSLVDALATVSVCCGFLDRCDALITLLHCSGTLWPMKSPVTTPTKRWYIHNRLVIKKYVLLCRSWRGPRTSWKGFSRRQSAAPTRSLCWHLPTMLSRPLLT
ncbi:MAG: hypothetical protein HC767_13935 [Akkermansiaceae bacterium]|nr:hypothetical protein [Akkermansiaceae bacterium]